MIHFMSVELENEKYAAIEPSRLSTKAVSCRIYRQAYKALSRGTAPPLKTKVTSMDCVIKSLK